MQDVSSRYAGALRLATVLAVLGLVGAAALIGVGVLWAVRADAMNRLAGLALLVAGGWTALLVVLLRGLTSLLVKANYHLYLIHDAVMDVQEQAKSFRSPMERLVANSDISDAAKSIAHRAKERETLRAAIREEIAVEDWDLAYALLDEEERRFGDTKEAAMLRAQIDAARQAHIDEEIDHAMHEVEQLCVERMWDRAHARGNSLSRRFPEDARVRGIPDLIQERQAEHKRTLMLRWREAVNRKDTDGGIDILRELDPYLTKDEVKELEVAARGVFHEKLMNMRVQFSLAVKERRWHDAVQVAETIMSEYPNSRMAQEVSDNMEVLRARADGQPIPSPYAGTPASDA